MLTADSPLQMSNGAARRHEEIVEADSLAFFRTAYTNRADYTGEGWDHPGYCPTPQEEHHD